jgi:hypothetical protein
MIRECDIRRRGDLILVGIALDNAVLDFETTQAILRDCLMFLDESHIGLASMSIGTFGPFQVTLNKHHDGDFSIFVDGPHFEPQRELCAAIWLSVEELRGVITAALSGAELGDAPGRSGTS